MNGDDKATINSIAFFRIVWLCIRSTGLHSEMSLRGHMLLLYNIWGYFMRVVVMFGFPLHLLLAAFQSPNNDVNIRSFSMFCLSGICAVKFTLNTRNVKKMFMVENLLCELDLRVQTAEDKQYFLGINRTMRFISYMFLFFYFSLTVTGQMSVMSKKENTLMFNARFPFDWNASTIHYQAANIFQIASLSWLLVMNYANDCYPPMTLYLLSEHLELLCRRLARMGYNQVRCSKDHELQLLQCIKDQKCILRYNFFLYHIGSLLTRAGSMYDILQDLHKWPIFLQFTITAFSICVGMIALMFYAENLMDRFYYFVYFVCTTLEILPVCYYGTQMETVFNRLHGGIYACNWMDQTPTFKKHMIFFMERSLRKPNMLAGGMFRIHLDFFFSTIKGTYSLFTILSRSKV